MCYDIFLPYPKNIDSRFSLNVSFFMETDNFAEREENVVNILRFYQKTGGFVKPEVFLT